MRLNFMLIVGSNILHVLFLCAALFMNKYLTLGVIL